MKRILKKINHELHHIADGLKVLGPHSGISGNCSGIYGNCSTLRGDCSNLSGNLDECEISDDERKKGVNILDLIEKE